MKANSVEEELEHLQSWSVVEALGIDLVRKETTSSVGEIRSRLIHDHHDVSWAPRWMYRFVEV